MVQTMGKALSGVKVGLPRLECQESRPPLRLWRAPYQAAPAVASPKPARASMERDFLFGMDLPFDISLFRCRAIAIGCSSRAIFKARRSGYADHSYLKFVPCCH